MCLMPTNVNDAFNAFINEIIAISPNQKDTAKASKSYLFDQVDKLAEDGNIPTIVRGKHLQFGSFYRGTKNTPLDDIDVIVCYHALNSVSMNENSWDNIKLIVNGNDKHLLSLCDKKYKPYSYGEYEYELNSNKVKNNLLSNLQKIENYGKAELHARGEAVTLSLKSYDWTFDIVPAFHYEKNNETIYVIPNGNGKWKKTNPKKEMERVKENDKLFYNMPSKVIRLVKYWNKRGKMPTITSYVLETAVLDFFDTLMIPKEDQRLWPDLLFRDALKYISNNISKPINDSKGIEGNINNLSYMERFKIQERAGNDYRKACNAIKAELEEKDMKKSINVWRDIFGDEFPAYE